MGSHEQHHIDSSVELNHQFSHELDSRLTLLTLEETLEKVSLTESLFRILNCESFEKSIHEVSNINQREKFEISCLFNLLDFLRIRAEILADELNAVLWYDGADQLLAFLRFQTNNLHFVVPRTAKARQDVLDATPHRQHGA